MCLSPASWMVSRSWIGFSSEALSKGPPQGRLRLALGQAELRAGLSLEAELDPALLAVNREFAPEDDRAGALAPRRVSALFYAARSRTPRRRPRVPTS